MCPRDLAEQARMRPDLGDLRAGEEETFELQLHLARCRELITDQTIAITRTGRGRQEGAGPGVG